MFPLCGVHGRKVEPRPRILNTFPNNKMIDLPKFKAFTHDNSNVAKMATLFCHKIANIVGKEDVAGYQHFLVFPQCFQKLLLCGR